MRLLIRHTIKDELELPIAYGHMIQGMIYYNLKEVYDYSAYLHDKGVQYGQRKYKLFTFSLLRGKYYVKNKKIIFYENVELEISSPDIFLMQILAAKINNEGIWYGKNHYKEVEVYISDDTVECEQITIKMLSPVCAYSTDMKTGKTIYYSPKEEDFSRLINENFFRKYIACYGIMPESDIKINICKLTENDKYVTKYKGIYVTAWMGEFELLGKRKYLDFLYQTGLGSKNAQGFGMFAIR